MAVRVGASLGPVSISGRVSPTARETRAMAQGFGTLLWLTLALMVLAVLLPPVIVLATVHLWRTRHRRTRLALWSATAASVVAVAFASWAWPAYYGYAKYGTPVPTTSGYDHVGEYTQSLTEAGFTRVTVTRVDQPGKGPLWKTSECWVESVSPKAGSTADRRKLVTVTANCPRETKS